jgi:hypothetical protein
MCYLCMYEQHIMYTQLYAKYQQAVHGDTPDECDKGHFERSYTYIHYLYILQFMCYIMNLSEY